MTWGPTSGRRRPGRDVSATTPGDGPGDGPVRSGRRPAADLSALGDRDPGAHASGVSSPNARGPDFVYLPIFPHGPL